MQKIRLGIRQICVLVLSQLHTLFFLGGLYCLVQAAYFFSSILALIVLGIACFIISFLISRADDKGGG
ncbi:hypothetical protein [Melissococcus plutonius]|uniref:hypothetical protein n=1 Tax=Melissococcus plutonius TaxID=33970 RepID=UPI003C2C7788